ncbi:MAG: CapA family protein, partial [Chloroflexi bacterium]|nr:CapA family protein [Chloroflexota bacterium]
MAREEITLVGVGDVFVDRAEPESIFALSKDLLRQADIAFGQLETPYSDKGAPAFNVHSRVYGHDARNYPAIPNAGFDVISLASNLTYSWGPEAMLDCAERLRRDGIAPVGAGRNIEEARQPVFLERKGTRVAFLAYCSVAPAEDYADQGKPGVAPMRAFTHYELVDTHTPGSPPQILSAPYM